MKNNRHYGNDPKTGEEYFYLTRDEVVFIISVIVVLAVIDVGLMIILLGKLKILGLG